MQGIEIMTYSADSGQSFLLDLLHGQSSFHLGSGSHALSLVLRALRLPRGSEVLVTAFTCVSVVATIKSLGFAPIFVDVSDDSLCMDPAAMTNAVTERTAAVLYQHTFGCAGEILRIEEECRKRKLLLVEDCAHVLPGMEAGGRLLGTFGDASFFSFNVMKPLSCVGGGIARFASRELVAAAEEVELVPQSRLQGLVACLKNYLYSNWYRPEVFRLAQLAFASVSADDDWSGYAFPPCRGTRAQFERIAGQISTLEHVAKRKVALAERYCNLIQEKCRFKGFGVLPYLSFPVRTTNASSLLLSYSGFVSAWPGKSVVFPLEPSCLEKMTGYVFGSCQRAESLSQQTLSMPMTRWTLSRFGTMVRIINGLGS